MAEGLAAEPMPALVAMGGAARSGVAFAASNVAWLLLLLRRLRRRLLGLPCTAPRPGQEELHVGWLNRVLLAKGVISGDTRVVAAVPGALPVNRGFISTITKFTLTYNGVGTAGPASLVLKTSGAGAANRRAIMWGGQSREAQLYCSPALLALLPQGLLPRVLYASHSWWHGEYTVLMEDFSLLGVTATNLVYGNQIWCDARVLPRCWVSRG